MASIYKYQIPEAGKPFEVKIKGFCEVVHAGVDGRGLPCLWALVMPEQAEETWTFMLAATGQEFKSGQWCHLMTFHQGALVWHLLRPADQWSHTVAKDVS